MHGVRRESRPTAAQLERHAKQSALVADVIRRALVLRHSPLPNPLNEEFFGSYRLVENALLTNADEYTLWSFRREVLISRAVDGNEAVDQLWQDELNLTTRALRSNPKAYPAWQHRMWLLGDDSISDKVSRSVRDDAIEKEEKLTRLMLSKDCRNFHGWAHRMRIRNMTAAGRPNERHSLEGDELEFVESKINDDFANYSAWHLRSVLLPRVSEDDEMTQIVTRELHFVRQAFYTEPDVQSVWFYHRWLLAGAPSKGRKVAIHADVLRDELTACEELLDLEPEARHALQTKAHILFQLGKTIEARETLDVLEKLDPMRRGYYAYLRKKYITGDSSCVCSVGRLAGHTPV